MSTVTVTNNTGIVVMEAITVAITIMDVVITDSKPIPRDCPLMIRASLAELPIPVTVKRKTRKMNNVKRVIGIIRVAANQHSRRVTKDNRTKLSLNK